MPVINLGFPLTAQPLHLSHLLSGEVDFHSLGIQSDCHLVPDETRGRGIGVLRYTNRAPVIDGHFELPIVIQAIRRKRVHDSQFLLKPFAPAEVLVENDLAQKLFVFAASGKIAAASQEQRLVDSLLEPVVRLFYIPVLIGFARLILSGGYAVMTH